MELSNGVDGVNERRIISSDALCVPRALGATNNDGLFRCRRQRPTVNAIDGFTQWSHREERCEATQLKPTDKLAATLRGSRPGVQSASLIMTSLMTS